MKSEVWEGLKKDIPVYHSLLYKESLSQDKSCMSVVLEKLILMQTCAYARVGHQHHSRFYRFYNGLSKHRILVGFEPTHTYIQPQRWACYYTLHTHIFSFSLAQTLTHARAGNQPASRFDTLPVLWSGQRRDGFSHHRLWSLREEEVVCVHDMGEGRYWH